jgi:hypothetical protein
VTDVLTYALPLLLLSSTVATVIEIETVEKFFVGFRLPEYPKNLIRGVDRLT